MSKIKIISQFIFGSKRSFHCSGFIVYYQNHSCKWAVNGKIDNSDSLSYEQDRSNLTNFKLELEYDL